MTADELTHVVIHALEDVKAVDIRVLDVRGMTGITDVMVIASGNSDRQVRALANNVIVEAKEHGVRPIGVEGERQGQWVLVDLGDVVVHIMLPETREFYGLERLWGGEDEVKVVRSLKAKR
jgi:ribosome-associated protein